MVSFHILQKLLVCLGKNLFLMLMCCCKSVKHSDVACSHHKVIVNGVFNFNLICTFNLMKTADKKGKEVEGKLYEERLSKVGGRI